MLLQKQESLQKNSGGSIDKMQLRRVVQPMLADMSAIQQRFRNQQANYNKQTNVNPG